MQVAQLETQLAAAERCSAELRDITTALGSVRSEDVETLRVRACSSAAGSQQGTIEGVQQGSITGMLWSCKHAPCAAFCRV